MKLNKREKILVFTLLAILLVTIGYKFLITPFRDNLAQLTSARTEKALQYQQMQEKLQSKARLEEDKQRLNDEILNLAALTFGSLYQEDIILLLNDFIVDNNIKITHINFLEPVKEILVEEVNDEDLEEDSTKNLPTATVHSVQVNYEGDYDGLINTLKKIREHEKKIIIDNLTINNNHNGLLSGDLLLDFYTLDEVNKYIVTKGNVFEYEEENLLKADEGGNPFKEYEIFVEEEEIDEGLDSGPDINADIKNMTLIYGFENENIFFVGEPRDVYGKVSLDTNSLEGRYSNQIQYDFIRRRDHSIANLVFDGEPIKIERQPEILSLSIYSYETNTHNIGLVLIDSKGREFKVPLKNEVRDWGWETIETTLPIEITYPVVLQRIYIESNGFSNKLQGHFSFDKLHVLYPDN